MRPTLPEQLRGLRRILETTVSPAVHDDYPQTTLQGVIRALEALEQHVNEIGPFLAWDSATTAALLVDVAAHVAVPGLDAPAPVIGIGDLAGLDTENERVRGLLAGAIPALASTPAAADTYARVVQHLRERIARYPFVSTGSLPTR
jgi:hypothetical protein